MLTQQKDSKVLAFWRYDDFGKGVAVILNFSNNKLENYSVKNFPAQGNLKDWLSDYEFEQTGEEFTGHFEPFEAKVFVQTD